MTTADPGLDAAIERVAETAPISSLVGRVGQLPSAAGRAMTDLGDRVVDRVMSTPHRVENARDAIELLGEVGDGTTAMQGVLATGFVALGTRLIRMGRWGKFPTVAVLTGTAAVASSVRGGVGELQVVGSYLASRLDDAGIKADTDVYLNPGRAVDLANPDDLGASRLLAYWLRHSGAIPIVSRSRSERHRRAWIDAVDRLDLPALWAEWQAHPRTGA